MSVPYAACQKIRIRRHGLGFSAAHFTIFGSRQRDRLHGHDYHVGFQFASAADAADIVKDCRLARAALRGICNGLHERVLIPSRSPFLRVTEGDMDVRCEFNGERFLFPRGDVQIMEVTNVTLESTSQWIAMRLYQMLGLSAEAFGDLTVFVSAGGGYSAESSLACCFQEEAECM